MIEAVNIVEQGCVIKKSDIRFVIYKEGILKEYIPYFKVSSLILWGNQQITTAALNLAFEKGIDVIFLNFGGKLKGRIEGTKSKNVYLRLAQYELWRNKNERIKYAKRIIINKIENQRKFLNYYNIDADELIDFSEKIKSADEISEIMGYEGICSKIYFGNIKNILSSSGFKFEGRNRRPPKDEINALLSLTYSMVLNKISGRLESIGMDSYLGFVHSIKYGREALALDMLEEFRQPICDHFVIKLIKRKEFKKSDFIYSEENGMRFKEEAFRRYLSKYNKESDKLDEIITNQCEIMRKSILSGADYIPYKFNKRKKSSK